MRPFALPTETNAYLRCVSREPNETLVGTPRAFMLCTSARSFRSSAKGISTCSAKGISTLLVRPRKMRRMLAQIRPPSVM